MHTQQQGSLKSCIIVETAIEVTHWGEDNQGGTQVEKNCESGLETEDRNVECREMLIDKLKGRGISTRKTECQ